MRISLLECAAETARVAPRHCRADGDIAQIVAVEQVDSRSVANSCGLRLSRGFNGEGQHIRGAGLPAVARDSTAPFRAFVTRHTATESAGKFKRAARTCEELVGGSPGEPERDAGGSGS